MLEIICLGVLALSTDVCANMEANSVASRAIELNIAVPELYLAGRPYESDYSREAERIKDRHNYQNHRRSSSRRYRIERDVYHPDGGCVDERGRIYRTPDRECTESRERIERSPARRYEDRNNRNRIFREPD